MKFVKFEQATHALPTRAIVEGKDLEVLVPFYSEKGFVVLCAELSEEELKQIKMSRRIFIIAGPNINTPPIMTLQIKDPFVKEEKPKSKLVDLKGNPIVNGKGGEA